MSCWTLSACNRLSTLKHQRFPPYRLAWTPRPSDATLASMKPEEIEDAIWMVDVFEWWVYWSTDSKRPAPVS